MSNIEEDGIDLKSILIKFTSRWHWFLIGALTCLIIAFLYGRYTPPIYSINAKLLVSDDEKGGGMGKQAGSLMDLGGILGSKNSVDNEIEILKTRFLLEQVVRRMELNVLYLRKSGLVKRELYKSPFKLAFIKSVDTIQQTHLTVEKLPGNLLKVQSEDFQKEVKWNENFKVPKVGVLQLIPVPGTTMPDQEFIVAISSIDDRVSELMPQLFVGLSNKQVSVINLGLNYPVPAKGEDILNTIISQYTTANVNDKNAIADITSGFIKDRLKIISSELGDVEDEVEDFKQRNKLADMTEQGKLLVQTTGQFSTELAQAETQVSVLNDLENYLKDDTKNKRVFPSSLISQDMVFSDLMNKYNALLIERDRTLLSVTEKSPFIQNLDAQISGLRNGILENIRNTKNSFVQTRNKLRSQLNTAQAEIGGVPQVEKVYLKLARNQQIKQELYIFLMQKAEETSISKTANISVAKLIDPPKSMALPISPRKSMMYAMALAIGLILPVILILIREFLKVTITSREDITSHTNVPVIGEISHNPSSDNLIVANQSRSAISEQFRALRTNLSFYLKSEDEKVVMLTSSMSGEGKSFTAINLANILALTGKKVLLMELDLRKPGLSAKLNIPNQTGFSNYTISNDIKIDDIIKPVPISKNLFIISSGPLPPNPAETLMSEHTPALIQELKKRFDYIIMDAPPVGIITDAQLLAPYADVTMYLVRQKITRKDQLAIVEDLYQSGKIKNLGIVVNDIVNKDYGYGYGYGNYGEETNTNWFSKIFKRS